VLAGWEGGSAAFDSIDAYSDLDLEYLVADDASLDDLYASAERALNSVSAIMASHSPLLGRYYRLENTNEFLVVDLVFLRVGDPDRRLETERHGTKQVLFDKGGWLRPTPLDARKLASDHARRLAELKTWFPMSQLFVRKAVLRGQHVEAVHAYWACTLRPLADLLRIRYAPARWDFGMRYLDRDLPPDVYSRVRDLALVTDLGDLDNKLARASGWGTELLQELT
jgi:hypothetical protein